MKHLKHPTNGLCRAYDTGRLEATHGYATHLGRFGGRHCDKTFGHVHFDHSDLGQLGVLLVVLSVAIKTLAWRSVG